MGDPRTRRRRERSEAGQGRLQEQGEDEVLEGTAGQARAARQTAKLPTSCQADVVSGG